MELLPILERYQTRFRAHYADRLTRDKRRALDAMLDCRTARFGEMQLHCPACRHHHSAFHACGHRSCPRCQHHDTARWLERQQRKLLPVNYFMATFTLPAELRPLARRHPKTVYAVLFDGAVSTLKDFGANSARLGADMGMTAVLHTHSRRLDYHPHVHVVVAGGCLNKVRKQWKRLRGRYCSTCRTWPGSSARGCWRRCARPTCCCQSGFPHAGWSTASVSARGYRP